MYYVRGMEKISDICDALGRKEMGLRLGVSKAAIANAVSDGKFPARWYSVISAMCAEVGVDCSETLFGFIPVSTPEDAA